MCEVFRGSVCVCVCAGSVHRACRHWYMHLPGTERTSHQESLLSSPPFQSIICCQGKLLVWAGGSVLAAAVQDSGTEAGGSHWCMNARSSWKSFKTTAAASTGQGKKESGILNWKGFLGRYAVCPEAPWAHGSCYLKGQFLSLWAWSLLVLTAPGKCVHLFMCK